MLTASSLSIPLIGRGAELEDLERWLTDPYHAISIRILVSDAGLGKTRLALELCDKAESLGWRAGFLSHAELGDFPSRQRISSWSWGQKTLMVVDYFGEQAELLNAWLAGMADHDAIRNGNRLDRLQPLRILLVERQVAESWRDIAFGRGAGRLAIEGLLDPIEPITLRPIEGIENRRAVLVATLNRIGATTAVPAPGEDTELDGALRGALPHTGDPLYLMMAALKAGRENEPIVLGTARTDLAFWVAKREASRIEAIAKSSGVSSGFLVHLAAYATLSRGLAGEELREVINEERLEVGYYSADPPDIGRTLIEALGTDREEPFGVLAIRPELIGEALLIHVWNKTADGVGAVSRASRRVGVERVASVIVRAGQDFVGSGDRSALDWFDSLVIEYEQDVAGTNALLNSVPTRTVAFRDAAAALAAGLVAHLRTELVASPSTEAQSALSRALTDLSTRLNDLGRWESALEASEEAVRICRELVTERPDAIRFHLVLALNNLSYCLSNVGRREEARLAIEEAVNISGGLAAGSSWMIQLHQAMSLHNRAIRLNEDGRVDPAISTMQEAVDVRRRLMAAPPNTLWPELASSLKADLALSLTSLSIFFSELGRSESGLQAAEEAVTINRALAALRPDAFRPSLASSLSNLAVNLNDLGRREEALEVTREALAIHSELADQHPDAFRADLARSQNNLSTYLANLGLREQALAAIEQAVRIRRELANERPDVHRAALASSLNNLSNCLSDVGRCEMGLDPAREAVMIYRNLAVERPDSFRLDLAQSLNTLSNRYGELESREAAVEAIEEAVTIYQELAGERPDVFQPKLANLLTNLSGRLGEVGKKELALDAAGAAVAILRELAAERPAAFLADLARSLNNLSICLGGTNDFEPALEAITEAVRIYHKLAAERPEVFQPDLFRSLTLQAYLLSWLGRHEVALAATEESLRILRPIYLRMPKVFEDELATILANYASLARKLNRPLDRLLLEGLPPFGLGQG